MIASTEAEGPPAAAPGEPSAQRTGAAPPDEQAPDAQAPDAQAPDAQAPDAQAPDAQAPDEPSAPRTRSSADEHQPARRARPLPPDERRAALVAATLPLVRQHGPEVSTRQIAEAAGVAEGTIFRVFADKASLVSAAIDSAFDPAAVIARLDAIDRSLPLAERLVAAVRVLQDYVNGVVDLMMTMRARQHPVPEARRHQRERDEAIRRVVVQLIEPDHAQLRIPPAELARLLRFLIAASAMPWLNDGEPLRAEQIVEAVLDGARKRETSC